jgi:hypothetical protein
MFSEYAFDTAGTVYAATLDSLSNVYFYHGILLNRRSVEGQIVYTPFARFSLGNAPFAAKSADRELAVFWDITFK